MGDAVSRKVRADRAREKMPDRFATRDSMSNLALERDGAEGSQSARTQGL